MRRKGIILAMTTIMAFSIFASACSSKDKAATEAAGETETEESGEQPNGVKDGTFIPTLYVKESEVMYTPEEENGMNLLDAANALLTSQAVPCTEANAYMLLDFDGMDEMEGHAAYRFIYSGKKDGKPVDDQRFMVSVTGEVYEYDAKQETYSDMGQTKKEELNLYYINSQSRYIVYKEEGSKAATETDAGETDQTTGTAEAAGTEGAAETEGTVGAAETEGTVGAAETEGTATVAETEGAAGVEQTETAGESETTAAN